ncbi:hypothetical protein RB195_007231 [Necator americanus]|uniref:Uncharacterized protein n=1 Tax=Necator americanus TaxID=51031 RepID=A0ABR1BXX8_NECAM
MRGLKDDECRTKFPLTCDYSCWSTDQEKTLRCEFLHKVDPGCCKGNIKGKGDKEWTSRAKEFEKAWKDKNPRKAYALLKQYSGKMKRCNSVLNTSNRAPVGEAIFAIWRDHFKTLLNRQAPSAPELGHLHGPTFAVNEEPTTESEALVCVQKMRSGKSG